MKLRIFVPTVGEPFVLETLQRLRASTPEHTLTVWHEVLGSEPDPSIIFDLTEWSDDVISAMTNHGIAEVANFSLLMLDYDYLLVCPADCWVEPDYFEKLMKPFREHEKVASTGCWRGPMGPDLVWAQEGTPDIYPDGCVMFSKAAVDEVGGFSPSFHGHSQCLYEWHMRCLKRGWKAGIVKDVMVEQGDWHEGRKRNPHASKEVEASAQVCERLRAKGWGNYDWWRSDL